MNTLEGKAANDHEDDQDDDTAAEAAAEAGLRVVAVEDLVDAPLDEDDGADADEQQRPPLPEPGPEEIAGELAELDEEKEHTNADDEDRAGDRAAAEAAILVAVGLALGAEELALGTCLVAHDAPLVLVVAPVGIAIGWSGRRAGRRRIGWRIACHD